MKIFAQPTLFIASIMFSALSISSFEVNANPSSDTPSLAMEKLSGALSRLNGERPVGGHIVVSFNDKQGEGKKLKEKSGQVNLTVQESVNGLTTSYSKDIVENMKQESALLLEDEEAPTPTIDAINDFSMTNINNLLSPVDSINRLLKFAQLTRVEHVTHNGEGQQKLHFKLPMEAIITNKRTREYVDDFDGTMVITIDEDGTPLQLSSSYNGSGRAYVVFSVKAAGSRLQKFDVVGNRLVMTVREVFNSYDSTFGKGENSELHLFTPNVNDLTVEDHFAKTSNETSM